ncbi:MAG: VWA domain-containing protein [Deltaproteobacteria bacterium]|nr:VWA domain-containing protein [Deltaproteobacteria bacterium]
MCRPVAIDSTTKKELLALFDVSFSTSGQAREALVEAIKPYVEETDEFVLKLIPFAKRAPSEPVAIDGLSSLARLSELSKKLENSADSGGTDIGKAIQTVSSMGSYGGVLLLSDGHETLGNSRDAAVMAKRLGLKVFPVVPDESNFRELRLSVTSLHAASVANVGEQIPVQTSIRNELDKISEAYLEIWLDQQKLFSETVTIPPKQERLFTVTTPEIKGGLQRIRVELKETKNYGKGSSLLDEKHRWLSAKEKAQVLLISGADTDARILKPLLKQNGYSLHSVIADRDKDIPISFEKYSTVILNNVAKRQLPESFLGNLKNAVEQGTGLVLVGGERSFGLGGYIDTPLERISPLKFAPPRTTKRRLNSAVILVIDKSRSMIEEDKIVAAKRAALVAIDALKDDDLVGVIGFDSTPFVIIRLDAVPEVRQIASRRLQNLTAAGRTNLLPALAFAKSSLAKAEASRKHVIILSDGKVENADSSYFDEISSLRKVGVTVSTIALGLEADVPFLKGLSSQGKGAFYHTLDPNQLPQIFLHDIKVSTGEKTMRENAQFPVIVGSAQAFSSDVSDFPPVLGFVETLPKKGSELELITQKDETNFPIMASWNYGDGKVIAYTSDANGRWSNPWIEWPSFNKFWIEIFEASKSKSNENRKDVDFDLRHYVDRGDLVLDLAIFDTALKTKSSAPISAKILDPNGEVNVREFEAIAKGRFKTNIEKARPGDYKIDIKYGKIDLPTAAVTITGDVFGERKGLGIDVKKLSEIAFLSGGSLNPAPADLLRKVRTIKEERPLHTPLIIAAFVLILMEALARELMGVSENYRCPTRP